MGPGFELNDRVIQPAKVIVCKNLNNKIKDGEDMLLFQGVLAFELFTKTKADERLVEAMRRGLKGE